jgi:hypothetical protein
LAPRESTHSIDSTTDLSTVRSGPRWQCRLRLVGRAGRVRIDGRTQPLRALRTELLRLLTGRHDVESFARDVVQRDTYALEASIFSSLLQPAERALQSRASLDLQSVVRGAARLSSRSAAVTCRPPWHGRTSPST